MIKCTENYNLLILKRIKYILYTLQLKSLGLEKFFNDFEITLILNTTAFI